MVLFLNIFSRFLLLVKINTFDFSVLTLYPTTLLNSLNCLKIFYIFIRKFFFYKFIYLFLAVLGLRFCARAFSSCGERGPLFIAVRGPLTIAASLVAGHRLQTHRLSSCGSRVQLFRGMWVLPRPGFKPVSPALAGRFSTAAPPGKPLEFYTYTIMLSVNKDSYTSFFPDFLPFIFFCCLIELVRTSSLMLNRV